jgi:hypothetical protein
MQTPRKQVYSLEIEDSDRNTMLKLEKLMSFYEASCVVGNKQLISIRRQSFRSYKETTTSCNTMSAMGAKNNR